MNTVISAADIITGLLGIVVTGLGWWLKSLSDDVKKARDEIAAHKLFAAENYLRENDLQKLRDELIGHLDRIEKMVATAIQQRRRVDPAE